MAVVIIIAVILVLGLVALVVYNNSQKKGRILIKPSPTEIAEHQARQRLSDANPPHPGEGEQR